MGGNYTGPDKRVWKCNDCGKSLSSKYNIDMHTRRHSGEKPIDCNECGKKFGTRLGWVVHFRTHSRFKPYRCEVCDKGFSQKSNLLTHMKKHTTTHTGMPPGINVHCQQWRIQDFPRGGASPWGCWDTILLNFPENCMKSRKIWSLGGRPKKKIRHWSIAAHFEAHLASVLCLEMPC